ncbi:hypothetical protein [Methylobacterium sp. A54F]
MKRGAALGLLLAGALAVPAPALAASNTTIGVGSGAVAGALVGGPIGAVAGAIVGGVVGASTDRAGPRRHRRVRAVRRPRAAVLQRRPVERSAEAIPAPAARGPAVTGSVPDAPARAPEPAAAPAGGTSWRNPR